MWVLRKDVVEEVGLSCEVVVNSEQRPALAVGLPGTAAPPVCAEQGVPLHYPPAPHPLV